MAGREFDPAYTWRGLTPRGDTCPERSEPLKIAINHCLGAAFLIFESVTPRSETTILVKITQFFTLDFMNTIFFSNHANRLIASALLFAFSMFGAPLHANPSGQQVVAGNVNFQGLGTSSLDINNLSQAAIINWQSFSIQNGEVTRINQSANAVTLNRVTSGNPTAIYGALQAAQGGVMVINPNGIVVHKGGTIDVAGMLTLSTLDIKNEDFLDKGSNRFSGGSAAGIKNYGAITSDAGDVVLLGNFLQNAQGGTVTANQGVVAFGAGGDMLVEQTVNGSTISVLGGSGEIHNSGEITGAAAELKATGNVYSLAIKNDGVVRANGYNFKGGRLTLSGGSTGRVINTGQLSARNSDGSGGRVAVSGSNVSIGGSVDVSAANAGLDGGSVDIRGVNVAIADSTAMNASGAIGGSVSISGTESAVIGGLVDATGHSGSGGAIDVTAESLTIGSSATLDVSGATKGGTIRAGGGYQGNDIEIVNATTTTVEQGALMIADGAEDNGGNIFVWANGDTFFGGEISAQAKGLQGNGGFVEVSGKDKLSFRGLVSTLSANGQNGTLLLDPTDVVIGDAGAAGITISDDDLVTALGLNNVVLHTSSTGGDPGDITVLTGSDALNNYNSLNTLSFFAHGDIVINDNIQNAGFGTGVGGTGGAIIMFAGWDGTGASNFGLDPDDTGGFFLDTALDPAVTSMQILNGDYGVWGQNSGSVVINGAASKGVGVGSAFGETALFGHQISVNGGAATYRYGQVGFHDSTLDPTGSIQLHAKDDIVISAIGGTTSGNGQNDSYAIVGHGGSNRIITTTDVNWVPSGNGNLSGDITVISEGGGLYMRGGNDRSFSQIGHGGQDVIGDKDGNITVLASVIDMRGGFLPGGGADATNRAGTRIGHGGYESYGGGFGFSGDIYVKSASSIYGDVGHQITNGNGANVWQIGHGGWESGVVEQGSVTRQGGGGASDQQASYTMEGHTGSIYVESGGDITAFAGSRSNGAAFIGHGGYATHGNHNSDTMLSTGNAYTDGLKAGITVIAGGDIIFDRKVHPTVDRADSNSYVQIGNGGNRAGGRFSGDIDVQAGGKFEMHGGHSTSYAQVGHGGFADAGTWNTTTLNARNAHATLSGDISLVAGDDISMYAGSENSNAYAMVGHGGIYRVADGLKADGVTVVDAVDSGHHGDIVVNSGGTVTISAKPRQDGGDRGQEIAGSQSFAMIGHGGYRSKGDHYGLIDVDAVGDVHVEAGFGGKEEYRLGNDDRYVDSQTGDSNFAQIGHGGFASTLYRAQDTSGGYLVNGNFQGTGIGSVAPSDITIDAGGELRVFATQAVGALRSDHLDGVDKLDFNTGTVGGTITGVSTTASTVVFNSVGHGLADGDFIFLTNLDAELNEVVFEVIVIDADTFEVVLVPTGAIADFDGEFNIPTPRPVLDRAIRGYAKVGHGGYGDNDNERRMTFDSITTGDITINLGGGIDLRGGGIDQKTDTSAGVGDWNRIEYNFAQIGHGGEFFRSSYDGEILINAGGDISAKGGLGFREFALIGHGGYESGITPNDINSTTVVGGITVTTPGNISLTGGGSSNVLSRTGDTQFSYAQIGHGAGNMGLTVTEDIIVKAGGNLALRGGAGLSDAYAQIGHGALNNGDGNFTGMIDVSVGGNLTMVNTSGTLLGQNAAGNDVISARNYVKIGHGDTDSIGRTKSTGRWDGDINVMVGDNLVSVGGMIGHADPTNGDDSLTSRDGNTYIGVGRNAPNAAGGGDLITDADTTFTSSQFGVGSELRLYIPGVGDVDNFIAEGTNLNDTAYTRTPTPDGSRSDELIATEFTFTYAGGVPSGSFTPEGAYPGNSFGNYQIYYSDLLPPVIVDPGTGGGGVGGGGGGVFIDPFGFNFFPFLFVDFYEVFNRYEEVYGYDGYGDGLLDGLSAEERLDDERPIRASGWFLEEALDGAFGPRNARRFDDPANTASADEDDEERRRRLRRTTRQVGRGGNAIYVYVPGTNRYSSLRIFGVPSTDIR